MKIREARDMDTGELVQKNKELVEELFKLKLRHATGQLESPAMLGSVRKSIARIKTVLREREVQKT
ncbi:MAG TPA: 50S ribosomal protein L29 [Syntrophales bacterium]|nr:50S ribosomal protein L29 [Syntrophales bacterium]